MRLRRRRHRGLSRSRARPGRARCFGHCPRPSPTGDSEARPQAAHRWPGKDRAASGQRRSTRFRPSGICHMRLEGPAGARLRARVFTPGEPDGSMSVRISKLAKAMADTGFEAPIRPGIRWNIWLKLWGNVCFNPIAALTGAPLDRITSEPGLRALCIRAMLEAKAIS